MLCCSIREVLLLHLSGSVSHHAGVPDDAALVHLLANTMHHKDDVCGFRWDVLRGCLFYITPMETCPAARSFREAQFLSDSTCDLGGGGVAVQVHLVHTMPVHMTPAQLQTVDGIFAVHCSRHHLHLVSVPHLLPPEMGKVFHLDVVTLVLLKGKPRSINEPLTPHHRNTVLFFSATVVIYKEFLSWQSWDLFIRGCCDRLASKSSGMAAGFLVTLYEYSPLFYISVVSLCFVVTAAMVLGWFGFDVPVILRSSDETESLLQTPEKQMVQRTNPFILEMGAGPGSVADGVFLRPCCLEPCVLSCFWGCEVSALQAALIAHQRRSRLSTPQCLQEALQLRYHHYHSFHIASEDREECHTQIPADQGITDFGPLPRERYPLVAVLTLAEPEARNTYNIVASLTVIHVPDDKYSLSARVLFQYLLTSQGNMFELKPLFMSADTGGVMTASEPPDSEQSTQPTEPKEASPVEPSPVVEEGCSAGRGRDCVVCQNAAVNKVLLPCRHACVCDSCVSHFQHCPMCRAFVQESFTLAQGPAAEQ